MKTILVLTDFSFSGFNAARYALRLASALDSSKVILYNSYNPVLEPAGELPTAKNNTLKQAALQRMEDLELSLSPFQRPGTLLECLTDERPFNDAVKEICTDYAIDIVVAGAKNRSALGRLLIGTRLVGLINHSQVPVLVIPAQYVYQPMLYAVLATDLRAVEAYPVDWVGEALQLFQCKLLVLNVDDKNDDRHITTQFTEIGMLHKLLDKYQPEYHYTNDEEIGNGIRNFCKKHHAELIMLIHQEHSPIHKMFYKSVSTELVVNSEVPVLIFRPAGAGNN